jgi:adenylate cyclase
MTTPLATGRGVRPLPVGTVRHLVRIGALLYLVCGASILHIVATARELIDQPIAFSAIAVLAVSVGAVALLVGALADDGVIARLYSPVAHALVFGAIVLVSTELHFAGVGRWSVGACVYLIAPTFGFYIMERTRALAVLGAVAIGYAGVLVFGEGIHAPASQWTFLLAVAGATSVLVSSLAERADRMAASADAARADLERLNAELEGRVVASVAEVDRLSRLREFLSPQVADAVLSAGADVALAPHRRLIAILFCDLRGFTRFAAHAEPEEVLEVIQSYRDELVTVLDECSATIGSFAGDGVIAWFGDPVRCADPVGLAVDAALALQRSLEELRREWGMTDVDVGYGIGIAFGHATLGSISSRGRADYTALGSAVNLAARLCDEAADGEVLLDRRAHTALRDRVPCAQRTLRLKGFDDVVPAYSLSADSVPA